MVARSVSTATPRKGSATRARHAIPAVCQAMRVVAAQARAQQGWRRGRADAAPELESADTGRLDRQRCAPCEPARSVRTLTHGVGAPATLSSPPHRTARAHVWREVPPIPALVLVLSLARFAPGGGRPALTLTTLSTPVATSVHMCTFPKEPSPMTLPMAYLSRTSAHFLPTMSASCACVGATFPSPLLSLLSAWATVVATPDETRWKVVAEPRTEIGAEMAPKFPKGEPKWEPKW